MADANDNDPDVALTGPSQRGRGVHGQYVYWICMQHPKPETVQRTGVKTPADFDRITFREMLVQSHHICESVFLVLCVQTAGQPAQQAPDASFAEANQRMHARCNDFFAKAEDNCNKHPHKLHILQ